ncbi:MAG: aryl-sulfate sulfotransferase, partial [Lewinella sp.]
VPLGASVSFRTQVPVTTRLTVLGEQPLERTFTESTDEHELPILGLYPNRLNTVTLEMETASGTVFHDTLTVETPPLPATFPRIVVTQSDRDRMEPGMHLIDLLLANNGTFLPYTVMFDDAGTVRWYMDMSENEQITYTPYRLENGNWLYLNWIDLLEVDDLGRTVSQEQMYKVAGNHEVVEMTDGRLLMGGSGADSYVLRNGQKVPTRFDHVVTWDREKKQPGHSWDLREVLDVGRQVFPADYGMDPATDWFHVNSVFPTSDGGVIVSGRNQGVVRVDEDNSPRWILAPHRQWGRAGFDGTGEVTSGYLLTAVDSTGNPYPREVQNGSLSPPDFDWPMGQHSVSLLENGNLLLFDNGLRRNFGPQGSYSRAVEYEIDEEAKTVRQVWQYGKELGLDMYSPITSDIDVLPQTGNRLITSGNIRRTDGAAHAKLLEITHPGNETVFEADIYFEDALGTGAATWAQFDIVFRGERYPLLPE